MRIGEYRKGDIKPETEKDKVAISVLLGDISYMEEVLLETALCTVLNLLLFLGAKVVPLFLQK